MPDMTRHVVPRGTAGELLTRGYCVMPKYWGDAERTAKAIDEAHWIASGDITFREHVEEDLDKALDVFLMLFSGANTGKLILKIADE